MNGAAFETGQRLPPNIKNKSKFSKKTTGDKSNHKNTQSRDRYQGSGLSRRGVICRTLDAQCTVWSRLVSLRGSLSTRVFETRTVTRSELFSLLTCIHTTTFTLLSIFSPLEMSSNLGDYFPSTRNILFQLPSASQKRECLNFLMFACG